MQEFIWDGSHLVQEIDHKTNRTYCYIYSHPNSYEPLAQLVFAKNSKNPTACYYYHNDQIGVPRELTDENGKLCWYGDYTGWGKLKDEYALVENIHQPFRLQNQYADEETGLHYNFFRYYEPNIGRFTQLDPIGLLGGNNLYRFEGTAQNAIDPLGLFVPVALGGTEAGAILLGGIFVASSSADNSPNSVSITHTNGIFGPKPQCPDDTYEQLNQWVEEAKKRSASLGKCLPEMTKEQLDQRIDAANEEYNARKIREDMCWNGGDEGHKKQLDDIKNRIRKCARYY